MKYWTYKTNVGTFWIKPNNNGGHSLGINDELLGNYPNAVQAADDVYMCATGYYEWDARGVVTSPTDLSEWTQHVK